jgi:peptide chain release factor 2
MYDEQAAQLKGQATQLAELRRCLKVDHLKEQITELDQQMAAPGFWDDSDAAQKVVQKRKQFMAIVAAPDALHDMMEDAQVLIELGQSEGDESLGPEITEAADAISAKLSELEITSLFSDPRDQKEAIVSIHPGAGGTESCDWADMLCRMILRFCERKEYNVEVIERQPGDEAGLKSITFTVSGPFAYGHLKSEVGVHRLIRISPFDAAKRRHTSFAAVEVLTPADDDIDIEVRDEDLKMDVYRSSGAGGQKVNKTSSAVRLTHLPTGIVVACQIERSQHRNRDVALQMIKAKLYDQEINKREAELASQREDQREVAWGSQIRSYTLQPFQLIKDHRSSAETGNVDRFLDGEIDSFVEAYLKWKLGLKDV